MRPTRPRAFWRMSLLAAASLLLALAGRPQRVAGARAACDAGALFAAPSSFAVGSAPQAIATAMAGPTSRSRSRASPARACC